MPTATDVQPFFSIIIPCYNRAHTIGRAIHSCIQQAIASFEIVVVDDGSTDHLSDVLNSFQEPRIRYLRQVRRGAAGARNAGVDAARGAYVAFLDSDDIFLSAKLSTVQRYIESKPDVVLYSQTYVDRGVGRMWIKPPRGLETGEDIAMYVLTRQTWVPVSTIVLPTGLAKKVRWDETLSICEDLDFVLHLAWHGVELKMIPEPLTVCFDIQDRSRLSLDPIYHSRTSNAMRELIRWIEREQTNLTKMAYLAFYARVVSRYAARTKPLDAFGYLWRAWRHGALSQAAVASQLLLTFAPRTYRWVCDSAVRMAGVPPPSLAAEAPATQGEPTADRSA